ncbi:related to FMP43 Found in Mitochondrial Proteome [Cephalotrichum gorgonifer]|uniref:Mitochondrial pyruvate carrier n=1 Tax=Cephalotrichum gorgonifer TaxID=2041049 RepID=A0AAE8N2S4_9PEZI|nr:related to FMP43 Found in Mitochondrial Proteome [Cephalotrichum gorgonifer]
MSASRSFLTAARPLFRQQPLSSAWRARAGPQAMNANFRNGFKNGGRRWQSAAAGEQVSWFKRMWDSPVGLKTVHFWAPVMKWCLVIAGISDFARPVEKLSLTQNLALTATGIIWTRWCLIIKPKNYLLAAVNFFLGCVGLVQVSRIALHKPNPAIEEVKEKVEEVKA